MQARLPGAGRGTHGRTTVSDVLVRRSPCSVALGVGRFVAGARLDDAVRVAGELVSDGRRVALEHVPGRGDDVAAELVALASRVRTAGLADSCELTVPVDRVGRAGAQEIGRAGLAVVLDGAPGDVDALLADLPARASWSGRGSPAPSHGAGLSRRGASG